MVYLSHNRGALRMLTEQEKIEALVNLSIELNRIKDLDILMEHILTEARLFAGADAGSIYLANGKRLLFSYTQNDTLQKRLPEGAKLIYSTFSIPIDQHSIAGYTAMTASMLNIPDVALIDPGKPYQFNRKFDDSTGYVTRSILTVPLVTTQGGLVGVLQMINAGDASGHIAFFSEETERLMLLFASMAAVALERAKLTRNMILRTIRMAEMRDPKETGAHVNRVAGYAIELYENWARKKGVARKEIESKRDALRMAAMLHDVGKVAIPDTILKKAGKLTEEEYTVMKTHTILGAQLFMDKTSDFDEAAVDVAFSHHERWDGRGYPGHVIMETGAPEDGYTGPDGKAEGKSGEEIPLFGRLVAIADVYDALSSRRSYKESWDETDVLENLRNNAGSHFDPELIDIFFSCLDVIRQIRLRYPDEDIH
jgi:HD-GYP domain-containing protein (c-di-GMP phosphodiesterase class II)